MELIHLIYSSSATRPMQPHELAEMLAKARENNRQAQITGMLLYHNSSFLQVIEGEEPAITTLFKKITKDPRHHDITLLRKRFLLTREFEKWEMGFANIDALDTSRLPGYTSFMNPSLNTPNLKDVSYAYSLLNSFKENMR